MVCLSLTQIKIAVCVPRMSRTHWSNMKDVGTSVKSSFTNRQILLTLRVYVYWYILYIHIHTIHFALQAEVSVAAFFFTCGSVGALVAHIRVCP